jgi:hypothetical protein
LFSGGASSQANVIVSGRRIGGEDEERTRKGKDLCVVWSLQGKWKGEVRRAVVRQDLNKP